MREARCCGQERLPVDGAFDGALALRRGEVRDCATDTRHGWVPANVVSVYEIRERRSVGGDIAKYSRPAIAKGEGRGRGYSIESRNLNALM